MDENKDFTTLIELINKKIADYREQLPVEQIQGFDSVCKDLFGLISVYDGWLKENDELMRQYDEAVNNQDENRIITLQ